MNVCCAVATWTEGLFTKIQLDDTDGLAALLTGPVQAWHNRFDDTLQNSFVSVVRALLGSASAAGKGLAKTCHGGKNGESWTHGFDRGDIVEHASAWQEDFDTDKVEKHTLAATTACFRNLILFAFD